MALPNAESATCRILDLLSGGFRSRRLCGNLRRLLRRRFLCYHLLHGSFLRSGLLCGDRFRFRRCRLLCRPPFLQGGDDVCPTSITEFSFRLWRFLRGGHWRRRLSPDLCPSPLLGFLHAPSSGSGEFLSLTCGSFRRGGGFCTATGEHGTEFANLIVNPALLRFKAFDGGGDDFVREFCRHVVSSESNSVPLRSTLASVASCHNL